MGRITTLFLDIGGVLLTNGWDQRVRRRVFERFGLNYDEFRGLDDAVFDAFETGKMSLEEYLERVVFHKERSFSRAEFREFMFAQSIAFPEMIALMRRVKARNGLTVVAVNNEGRELAEYRHRAFELRRIFDLRVSSWLVHLRKPDEAMYRLALDAAQARAEQVVYVDDNEMFVEVARGLGIRGVCHKDYQTTRAALGGLGLDS